VPQGSRGRLRVALVYRSFNLAGSLARETVELARHLSHRHEVHVFSIASRTDSSLAPECTFHAVPVWSLGDGQRFSARELASFARHGAELVSRERFDVVHTCAPSTWVGNVLHVPGVSREEARLQGIPAWRYAAQALRHPGDAVRRRLERKSLGYLDLQRLHAAAPSVRDALEKHYGISPADILIVPPAVNLDEFQPVVDKAAARAAVGVDDPDVLVLLFCGSAFARKGLDRAIVALGEVRANALLLVVGGGPEEPYRRLAATHGVREHVRFLGVREDAWRFYQAADIVLLPTRADVWGITPFEGMACGVPPIVTAAAGSASAVVDGETGIVLAEPFANRALVHAIERLASDPVLRSTMGEAGVDEAQNHSHVERSRRIEEDLVSVAEERLAGGGRASSETKHGLMRRRDRRQTHRKRSHG